MIDWYCVVIFWMYDEYVYYFYCYLYYFVGVWVIYECVVCFELEFVDEGFVGWDMWLCEVVDVVYFVW